MTFLILTAAMLTAIAWMLLSWRLGTARDSEWLQSQAAWGGMTSGALAFTMLVLAVMGALAPEPAAPPAAQATPGDAPMPVLVTPAEAQTAIAAGSAAP